MCPPCKRIGDKEHCKVRMVLIDAMLALQQCLEDDWENYCKTKFRVAFIKWWEFRNQWISIPANHLKEKMQVSLVNQEEQLDLCGVAEKLLKYLEEIFGKGRRRVFSNKRKVLFFTFLFLALKS